MRKEIRSQQTENTLDNHGERLQENITGIPQSQMKPWRSDDDTQRRPSTLRLRPHETNRRA